MHNAAQSTMRVLVLVSKHVHDHPHSPPLHRAWHRRPPVPRQQHAPRAACATASSAAVPVPTGRVFYRAVGFLKNDRSMVRIPNWHGFLTRKRHMHWVRRAHTPKLEFVHVSRCPLPSFLIQSSLHAGYDAASAGTGAGPVSRLTPMPLPPQEGEAEEVPCFFFFTRPKKKHTHVTHTLMVQKPRQSPIQGKGEEHTHSDGIDAEKRSRHRVAHRALVAALLRTGGA